MSNFTDFHAFKQYDDVRLKYVYDAKDLGNEDIIIFPGSKNTITDLEDLKKRGIFDKVKELKEKGKIIVGICGGLQMLGKKIYDPEHLESDILETEGFDFFDYETTFDEIKKTEQVTKKIESIEGILKDFSNYEIEGYEIHQGVSTFDNPVICKNRIFATYIHGIFDNSKFTNDFLNIVRREKNMPEQKEIFSFNEFKEKEYDKLAKLLRENLDIEEIYKIIEKK
ncbi:CobB/CobQ-like protein [Fusobacterium sp. oral taxon 370 str. F0437]|nr:CobB/CobQ-like protein [Fusobacterium sp. oral taxon 370 str. F0437]